MKSFVCKLDCGEIILTLKHYSHNNMFRIFLSGCTNDTTCDGVAFYQESRSMFVNPNKTDIFNAGKKLVNYHYVFENENEFEKWLDSIDWEIYKETV